ncbi:respiratory nitrate reductase subunit gamma [Chloroflexota bacterium]
MPIHLRWELYPVAHEMGHESGGSYLEEPNWWDKTPQRSTLGELKYMAREGLLFEKCYRNNRGLWYFTYPFHVGLFLLIIWSILLFFGALLIIAGVSFVQPANAPVGIFNYLTLAIGVTGFAIGSFGCGGLIIKRLTDENLRSYTSRADYFNLSFLLLILLSGLVSWLWFDQALYTAREFVKSLITFGPATVINPAMAISFILFSLFLVYLPFTHMMHGLAKYFTYHRIAWDDEPNLKGSALERKVQAYLTQPVNWSAPHIQRGKTWGEIASGDKEKINEKNEAKKY